MGLPIGTGPTTTMPRRRQRRRLNRSSDTARRRRMTKPHSALITGATGLIGSVLVKRLHAEKIPVCCLVRPGSRAKISPASALIVIETSFHADDLRKSLADISCDVVFHLASYGVQSIDRDPDQLIEGNIRLVSHLLSAVSTWPLR